MAYAKLKENEKLHVDEKKTAQKKNARDFHHERFKDRIIINASPKPSSHDPEHG